MITTNELFEYLQATSVETDYAGPESRLENYLNVSAAILDDSNPEAVRPSLFASCGCEPSSPACGF